MREEGPTWYPDDKFVARTRMAAFMRLHDIDEFDDLLRRAEDEPEWYWQALLEFFDIRFVQPWSEVAARCASLRASKTRR